MTAAPTYEANMIAEAIGHLQIARAALRHAGLDDAADEVDDIIARLTGDEDACDDDGLTDAEADAMTLASAGMGTDEDYGYQGSAEDY